eukprot:11821982-Prorocentrum_lima.AAC.1
MATPATTTRRWARVARKWHLDWTCHALLTDLATESRLVIPTPMQQRLLHAIETNANVHDYNVPLVPAPLPP